ncbi:diflavin oxidoreductase [Thermophagus xiamenensis]|uniref:Sulfite reductase (NADPH) flavoprotein alpha-component n=1 Tax=Thermophagus xiamenensis TaxID=385682 RepID=A0A1I1Y0X2_9BACT|nr:flavodoxin domain-containing protein [Thermophagus xiamenensis]SFE13032.1 sulfite reductase (NADPH) flavoprotein alpha-component [Thermophagus xiamenensis]
MVKKLLSWLFKTADSLNENQPTDTEITILYGSHSGNSEFIARETARYFKMQGIEAGIKNMAHYTVSQLSSENTILIVVSTYGEGDPPPGTESFFKELEYTNMSLRHLQYSVCALGDSDYEHFCQAGKIVDQKLKELGAVPLLARKDCDLNFRDTATDWIKNVHRLYIKNKHSHNYQQDDCIKTGTSVEISDLSTPLNNHIKKQNPAVSIHSAHIINKVLLNPGSSSEIYHIEAKIDPETTHYRPGDTISVIPRNPSPIVKSILNHFRISPDYEVPFKGELSTAGELLQTQLEITTLSKNTIKAYANATNHKALKALLENENKLNYYIKQHDLFDLITDFPNGLKIEDFINIPEKIRPRYYSIASSQEKNPHELHLTVKQIRFHQRKRVYYGACSNHLSWLKKGEKFPFKLVPNEGFRLPSDPKIPVIMIGAGTGIAPFIGFLHHRSINNTNKNWLIFGEKTKNSDFLYNKQIIEWKRQGLLQHLDMAFSREPSTRQYVQDKILEKADLMVQWINEGARIYVCGSVRMGEGVKQAINHLPLNKPKDINRSSTILELLKYQGQYYEDLY